MKRESDDQAIANTAYMTLYVKYVGKNQGWKKPNKPTEHLFKDNYMEFFVSETGQRMFAEAAGSSLKVAAVVAMRHKYMNIVLSKNVKNKENPVTQVIILGSGFDTRPVRKKKYSVKFFEVDVPETLDQKEAIYEQNNIDPNAVYIRMNYVTGGLINRLKKVGIKFDASTHFIWEGNTAYLSNETIDQIIDILKKNFNNATISFDYFFPEALNKQTGSSTLNQTKEHFESKGAGFVGSIEDIHAFAEKHQLTLIENYKMDDLLKKYRPDEKPDEVVHVYSLCTLKL